MTTLREILRTATNAADFARAYTGYVSELLARLDADAVADFIQELERARDERHTVFLAGNGGSASTAAHMANDFSFGVLPKPSEQSLNVRCLTDNVPVLTAIANDLTYSEVFVRQLEMYFRPGDRLVVLSASGNSANIVNAAAWVKSHGGVVIGLIGFDGGALKAHCDVVIHVRTPKGEYGPVEDLHLVINHLVTLWMQSRVRPGMGMATA